MNRMLYKMINVQMNEQFQVSGPLITVCISIVQCFFVNLFLCWKFLSCETGRILIKFISKCKDLQAWTTALCLKTRPSWLNQWAPIRQKMMQSCPIPLCRNDARMSFVTISNYKTNKIRDTHNIWCSHWVT